MKLVKTHLTGHRLSLTAVFWTDGGDSDLPVILGHKTYSIVKDPGGNTCRDGCRKAGGSGGDLLSHVLRRSTIGAEGFHGRVRDGIGCGPLAVTTGSASLTEVSRKDAETAAPAARPGSSLERR